MLSILICKFWSNFCSSFYEILLTMLKTMVCGVSTLNRVSFSMKYISSSWMFAIFFFLLFSLLYGHRVTVIYYSLFYSASGKTTKFGLSVDNLFQKYANKLLGMIEWVPFFKFFYFSKLTKRYPLLSLLFYLFKGINKNLEGLDNFACADLMLSLFCS